MIKQTPGIDYNSLLNRVSANYSNVNSARAALSRAIKDLAIFGLVRKQQNRFFATDKAVLLVNSEMKNKLVLKLNQAIASKKPETVYQLELTEKNIQPSNKKFLKKTGKTGIRTLIKAPKKTLQQS